MEIFKNVPDTYVWLLNDISTIDFKLNFPPGGLLFTICAWYADKDRADDDTVKYDNIINHTMCIIL